MAKAYERSVKSVGHRSADVQVRRVPCFSRMAPTVHWVMQDGRQVDSFLSAGLAAAKAKRLARARMSSPYLNRPLRTLEEAQRARSGASKMATYKVDLEARATVIYTMTVEADDEMDAKQRAVERAPQKAGMWEVLDWGELSSVAAVGATET